MKTNSPEDADIVVQKIPSDMGIHRNPRKGTLNAPEKILEDYKFSRTTMIDEVFPDEFSLENTHRRIEDSTEELLDYNKPLISIGGDHSISYPVIQPLKRKFPDMKLVWLDSHLDLKEKIDNHISHDVVVRELLRRGFSEDEIYFVGTTRVDEDEEDYLKDRNLQVFGPDEIEEFKREFSHAEHPIYLSVDIDVLKEEIAPGTGYPDGELSLETAKEIIETVNPDHADLVEVAPSLDIEGDSVKNARKLLSAIENTF